MITATTPPAAAAPIASQTPEPVAKNAMAAALDILQKKEDEKKITAPPVDPSAPAKPEEPAKPEAKEDPQSKRFAALAKRETALVKRDQELKSREAALTEKEKTLGNWDQRESDRKKEVALNPLKALEYYGISYQQVTDFILQGERPTPGMEVKAVRDELQDFKKQAEDERNKLIEDQKRAVQAEHEDTLKRFKENVSDFVKTNADKYELTAMEPDSVDIIVATIEEHFQRTKAATGKGIVLSKDEAADLVEKHFEAEHLKRAQAKKFAKANPEPQPEPKAKPPSAATQQPTLTNNMSPTTPSVTPALTDSDRIKRALAHLNKT